jgi:hypothetical protein
MSLPEKSFTQYLFLLEPICHRHFLLNLIDVNYPDREQQYPDKA